MSAVTSAHAVGHRLLPSDSNASRDRIELLDVSILDRSQHLVAEFAELARRLGIDLGWHYLLDLSWIAEQLGDPAGMRILDAGAGTGVLQWWLADHGAKVISADRLDRADVSVRFRLRYRLRGVREQDLVNDRELASHRWNAGDGLVSRLTGAAKAILGSLVAPKMRKSSGEVALYNHDLGNLQHLESNSIDAIVSVSALEHNRPQSLLAIVQELGRVLRPGRQMLVTLAATKHQDWLHEPSNSWCFTEGSLRASFQLRPGCSSNFDRFDEILAGLRTSQELQNRLSPRYFESGDNGMPWGVWDPKYVPVGIMKWKQSK